MRIYGAAQQIHEIRLSLFNTVLSGDSSYIIRTHNNFPLLFSEEELFIHQAILTVPLFDHQNGNFYRQMGILISFWRPISTNVFVECVCVCVYC